MPSCAFKISKSINLQRQLKRLLRHCDVLKITNADHLGHGQLTLRARLIPRIDKLKAVLINNMQNNQQKLNKFKMQQLQMGAFTGMGHADMSQGEQSQQFEQDEQKGTVPNRKHLQIDANGMLGASSALSMLESPNQSPRFNPNSPNSPRKSPRGKLSKKKRNVPQDGTKKLKQGNRRTHSNDPAFLALSFGEQMEILQRKALRTPIIFHRTEEQIQKDEERREQIRQYLLSQKAGLGYINHPDKLIEGMSEYLQKVGLETSFREEGDKSPRWQVIYQGLLDFTCSRSKLFKKNLKIKAERDKLLEQQRPSPDRSKIRQAKSVQQLSVKKSQSVNEQAVRKCQGLQRNPTDQSGRSQSSNRAREVAKKKRQRGSVQLSSSNSHSHGSSPAETQPQTKRGAIPITVADLSNEKQPRDTTKFNPSLKKLPTRDDSKLRAAQTRYKQGPLHVPRGDIRRFRGNMTHNQLHHEKKEFRNQLLQNNSLEDNKPYIEFMIRNYDKITELQQLQWSVKKSIDHGSFNLDYPAVFSESDPLFAEQHQSVIRNYYRERGGESVVKKIISGQMTPKELQQKIDEKSRQKLRRMSCDSFGADMASSPKKPISPYTISRRTIRTGQAGPVIPNDFNQRNVLSFDAQYISGDARQQPNFVQQYQPIWQDSQNSVPLDGMFGESVMFQENSDNLSNKASTLNNSQNEINLLRKIRQKRVKIQSQMVSADPEYLGAADRTQSHFESIGKGKIYIQTNHVYNDAGDQQRRPLRLDPSRNSALNQQAHMKSLFNQSDQKSQMTTPETQYFNLTQQAFDGEVPNETIYRKKYAQARSASAHYPHNLSMQSTVQQYNTASIQPQQVQPNDKIQNRQTEPSQTRYVSQSVLQSTQPLQKIRTEIHTINKFDKKNQMRMNLVNKLQSMKARASKYRSRSALSQMTWISPYHKRNSSSWSINNNQNLIFFGSQEDKDQWLQQK